MFLTDLLLVRSRMLSISRFRLPSSGALSELRGHNRRSAPLAGRSSTAPKLLLIVVLAASCLVGAATSCSNPPEIKAHGLQNRLGVFGPANTTPDAALGIGVSLVVGNATARPRPRLPQIDMIDDSPQKTLYRYACGRFQRSCRLHPRPPVPELVSSIRESALEALDKRTVVAWYLTDDDWSDFSGLLPIVRQTLSSVDPEIPTICAFRLPMVTLSSDTASRARAVSIFRGSLRNFSKDWCDAVLLYSYAPKGYSGSSQNVDWSMGMTLPEAVRSLKERGWDPMTMPLIGAPQAFGRDGKSRARRIAPSASQFKLQIESFCRFGAESIIPYTWNDQRSYTTLSSNRPYQRIASEFRHGCAA